MSNCSDTIELISKLKYRRSNETTGNQTDENVVIKKCLSTAEFDRGACISSYCKSTTDLIIKISWEYHSPKIVTVKEQTALLSGASENS